MVELSVFLFNRFGGKSNDLEKLQFHDNVIENRSGDDETPNDEVKVLICDNASYSDQKMSACARNYIIMLSQTQTKQKKKLDNKFIFRKLLNNILDDENWTKFDSEHILKEYKKKFEACKSKLNFTNPYFL